MIVPTPAQIVQVEDLLRGFAATPGAPADDVMTCDDASSNDESSLFRFLSFDSKSVLASVLAILVFAPGCAAGTVFLMRADDRIPPIVAPRLNPPMVAKSDRLPPDHWSPDAVEMLLGPKAEARIVAATVFEDPTFLAPMLIRGSIADGTITTFADDAHAVADASSIADAMALAPRPKPKRDSRRFKPAKLVAEIAPLQPEPPVPTFLEKLFGTRFN